MHKAGRVKKLRANAPISLFSNILQQCSMFITPSKPQRNICYSITESRKINEKTGTKWVMKVYYPVDIYLLKVNNRNTRTRC